MNSKATALLLSLAFACDKAPLPPATDDGPKGGGTGQATFEAGADGGEDSGFVANGCATPALPGELYYLTAQNLAGTENIPLCRYRGNVLLVFNGASTSPQTSQYLPLQALYAQYGPLGFIPLGFPSNQFAEELGTADEISTFVATKYHVTFPMFQKVDVNGPSAHPIFQWLKVQPAGGTDAGTGDLAASFEKFVVGRTGKLRKHFAANVQPDDPEVVNEIQLGIAESP